uniref:INO80 complex subunit B-like conserved region domain-containing protein n=1 Tax=Timspurckia oligopyrenoides TaxID=708627 RepID=A0A6T6LNJ5_9RHOD
MDSNASTESSEIPESRFGDRNNSEMRSRGSDGLMDDDEEEDVDEDGMDAGGDSLGSETESDSKEENEGEIKSVANTGRMTARQRAMLGEEAPELLDLSHLDQLNARKVPDAEAAERKERRERKRLQASRLRALNSEKKRQERQSATIEKVLRGASAKRRKQGDETRRLRDTNDMERDRAVPPKSVRIWSRRSDHQLMMLPDDTQHRSTEETIVELFGDQAKAREPPPQCRRDPSTGKRIVENAKVTETS